MEIAKWCPLCKRYVFPDERMRPMGWIGFLAATVYGGTLLIAYASSAVYINYLNATQGAVASLGFAVLADTQLVLLYDLWPFFAALFVMSLIYLGYREFSERFKEPRCPICNSDLIMTEPYRRGASHKEPEYQGSDDEWHEPAAHKEPEYQGSDDEWHELP